MKEYIPKSLRLKEKTTKSKEAWAIGILMEDRTVGMLEGPFFREIEALETISENGAKIFHFSPSNNYNGEIAWRWHNDRWIKKL